MNRGSLGIRELNVRLQPELSPAKPASPLCSLPLILPECLPICALVARYLNRGLLGQREQTGWPHWFCGSEPRWSVG
jgi:hypothetical protein